MTVTSSETGLARRRAARASGSGSRHPAGTAMRQGRPAARRPLNAELAPERHGRGLTPADEFFDRSHFPVPCLSGADWRLRVGGLVRESLELSLSALLRLGRRSREVTLECAGNGRRLFSPRVPGEQWGLGAVGSARWTGVPLAAVLDRAGIDPAGTEVIFRGADSGPVDDVDGPVRFERSLSIRDALASGALLAYEMNGEPLPPRRGFPVRLVVPGWYAVASVKWLTHIEVTSRPFGGYFQDQHYVFEWQRGGRRVREPVRLQKVRALITAPGDGDWLRPCGMCVRGLAWSGAAPVTQVEVAVGDGPWRGAGLVGMPERHGWQHWELPVTALARGPSRIRARACDAAGNDQLAAPEWNALGYGGNFVHEVAVTIW
jgi:DMSO/TMAO reductase YedYZ molybdopterin-dependent catalytic subunit